MVLKIKLKVIAAEGEHKAANALKDAADILSQSNQAIQLRYLQTLNNIAGEKNSTIGNISKIKIYLYMLS
jgi:erythrocyte band 7 integral membrane protein